MQENRESDLRPETIAVAAGRPGAVGQPLNYPIVAASNFLSGQQTDGREYSRGDGTETTEALERAVGQLEGGQAVSFSSGMAAVSSILDQLPDNARVLAPDDLYQGAAAVLDSGARNHGWQVKRLPTTATDRWLNALEGADLVWLESPSNPMLEVADLPSICEAANTAGIAVAVDNTFATPLLQQPLALGATFAIHSATKFIGGHSDLLAGVVVTNNDGAFDALLERRLLGGAVPGALEAFLALRGLRTLPVRLDRAQSNAQALAERLQTHRLVQRVHYPGLPEHAGYDLAKATMSGPGSMLSFELAGSDTSTDIRLSRLQLIATATSLGSVESTIERRAKLAGQEHIPQTLCRLSVGLEHIDDLWADLEQSFDGIN